MARPMKPLVRGGGYYPSRRWTPLVYSGGYTTMHDEGEQPVPILKTVTGNPIHILDALAKPAQALSVKLEPIQDLHGYDNPWPAGGGVNKLRLSDTAITGSSSGVDYSYDPTTEKITLSGTNTNTSNHVLRFFITSTSGFSIPTFEIGETYTLSVMLPSTMYCQFVYKNRSNTSRAMGYILGTNNFAHVTFTVPSDYVTFEAFQVYITGSATTLNTTVYFELSEGSTAPTAWTPYSNICPISGWTACKVTRTGKNLLNLVESEMISSGWNRAFPISVKVGTYIISCQNDFGASTNLGAKVSLVDESNTAIKDLTNSYNFGQGSYHVGTAATITAEEASRIKRILFQCRASGTSYSDIAQGNLQLELGSTATAYEPYQGQTYTIDLDGTRYGGTLDVTSGKLTVDKVAVTIDGNNIQFNQISRYGTLKRFGFAYPSGLSAKYTGNTTYCLADKLTPSFNNTIGITQDRPKGYYCFPHSSAFFVSMPSSTITSIAEANAWAVDNTPKVVYELATPTTIQLTPTQVELLLGENNIWSDGEMTLVYLADGNASDAEALNILLGGRYVNNHGADEPNDREALNIILGGNER